MNTMDSKFTVTQFLRHRREVLMAERKAIKPRKCDKCQCMIDTTAKGIQDHSAKCEVAQ